VPLLLRVPWLERANGRIAAPVSQVDLVPTLLDLLEQTIPGHVQGRSWRPELHHGRAPEAGDVVIEWNGPDNGVIRADQHTLPHHLEHLTSYAGAWDAVTAPVRTIVTPTGWTFTCSPRGEHEIYNLSVDPGETRNLMGDPAVEELVADLYERLFEWQERTGDEAVMSSDPRLP